MLREHHFSNFIENAAAGVLRYYVSQDKDCIDGDEFFDWLNGLKNDLKRFKIMIAHIENNENN